MSRCNRQHVQPRQRMLFVCIYIAISCLANTHAREPAARHYRECVEALGIPRVALMFLSKHDLPHRELWKRWLLSAEKQVPLAQLTHALHKASSDMNAARARLKGALDVCTKVPIDSARPMYRQFLFSFYLHNHPEEELPADRLFSLDEQVPDRVSTGWGQNSLVEAAKILMHNALKDHLNTYFVMVSDSSIPLYNPMATYLQLVDKKISAVDTCTPATHRWRDDMVRPFYQPWHWHKSSQWVGLTRAHAELASADTVVWYVFQHHCGACIADEHYIPTLLSINGLSDETDCQGLLHFVNFDPTGYGEGDMPWTYRAHRINATLIHSMRDGRDAGLCDGNSSNSIAHKLFANIDDRATLTSVLAPDPELQGHDGEHYLQALKLKSTIWNPARLHPRCHLFARKFYDDVASKLLDVLSEPSLGILPPRR